MSQSIFSLKGKVGLQIVLFPLVEFSALLAVLIVVIFMLIGSDWVFSNWVFSDWVFTDAESNRAKRLRRAANGLTVLGINDLRLASSDFRVPDSPRIVLRIVLKLRSSAFDVVATNSIRRYKRVLRQFDPRRKWMDPSYWH